MLIVSRAQDPEAWGRVCRIVTVSLEHSQSLQMIHVSCPLKTKKQGLTRFFEKWSHKVLNEIKFLLSASQKHGAECPELRFILLMFHGIHPIEDNKTDKLLRSVICRSQCARTRPWIGVVISITPLGTLGRVRGVSLNVIAPRRWRRLVYWYERERERGRVEHSSESFAYGISCWKRVYVITMMWIALT